MAGFLAVLSSVLSSSVTLTLLLLFIGLLVAFYLYTSKNYDLFKRYNIPGPTPLPFLFNLLDISMSMFKTDRHMLDKYGANGGEIVGYHEGMYPVVIVAKPSMLKEIMVKEFANFSDRRGMNSGVLLSRGETWKRIRSVLTPTFSSGKLRLLLPLMQQCVGMACDNLKESGIDKPIECKKWFRNFALDTAAASFFGVNLNTMQNPDSPYAKHAAAIFKLSLRSLMVGANFLSRQFAKKLQIFDIIALHPDSVEFFDKTIKEIILTRREELASSSLTTDAVRLNSKRKQDFIDILLAAEEGKESTLTHDEKDLTAFEAVSEANEVKNLPSHIKPGSRTKSYLTDDEIVAQAVVFLLAGYETTSSTIAFFVNALANHPNVQDRLREEINRAYRANNGDEQLLTYEQINSGLPYLDQCMQEVLRLWPAATRTERTCVRDTEIEGVRIPAGAVVAIPIFYLHNSDKYWPNAGEFDPERFDAEAKENIVPFSYLPFGQGPRNCLGMRFALLEMKVLLTTLVRRFRILPIPGKTEKYPELFDEAGGNLKAVNGLWAQFEEI